MKTKKVSRQAERLCPDVVNIWLKPLTVHEENPINVWFVFRIIKTEFHPNLSGFLNLFQTL